MEDFDNIDEQMQRALDIVENAADITDEQLAELDAVAKQKKPRAPVRHTDRTR